MAKEYLEKVEAELETNKHRYEELEVTYKQLCKELPLTEILDCMDSIVVSEGRKIEVKWRELKISGCEHLFCMIKLK